MRDVGREARRSHSRFGPAATRLRGSRRARGSSSISAASHGISPSGDKARVGAGARLGSVYPALWAAGHRTIPGGTAPTVGVAGLTLGGGHGFLARKLGLACDNLVAVEIVTADGKLRTCNAAKEKDLFWALRGAGFGSFGVVTSLLFRTTQIGAVATVSLEWEWARATEIVEAWTTFMATAPDELSTVLALRVPAMAGGSPKLGAQRSLPRHEGRRARGDPAVRRRHDAGQGERHRTDVRRGGALLRGKPVGDATLPRCGVGLRVRAVDGRRPNRARRPRRCAPRQPGSSERRCGAVRSRRRGRPGTEGCDRIRPPSAARFSVELVGLWDSPATSAANIAWMDDARSDDHAVPVGRGGAELRRSRTSPHGRPPTTARTSPDSARSSGRSTRRTSFATRRAFRCNAVSPAGRLSPRRRSARAWRSSTRPS